VAVTILLATSSLSAARRTSNRYANGGPSAFTKRTRVLPSGRPPEKTETLVQDDPTWALEYAHFKTLCLSGAKTDLANDIWLHRVLQRLSTKAIAARGGG